MPSSWETRRKKIHAEREAAGKPIRKYRRRSDRLTEALAEIKRQKKLLASRDKQIATRDRQIQDGKAKLAQMEMQRNEIWDLAAEHDLMDACVD